MIDLVELRARIAEKAAKGIHAAPVLFDIIEELEHARGERAAVVAYLKSLADAASQADAFWQGVASANGYAAQMIERGEHRREEER